MTEAVSTNKASYRILTPQESRPWRHELTVAAPQRVRHDVFLDHFDQVTLRCDMRSG